jgi:phage gp29-like protein
MALGAVVDIGAAGVDPSKPETDRIYKPRDIAQLTRRRFNGVTPTQVAGVLRNLEQGFYEQWADLCTQLVRDPTVRRGYITRRAAVVSKPVTVKPGIGADEVSAKRNADYAQAVLDKLDFESALYRQLDSLGVGIAVHEILWVRERGRWMPELSPVMTRDLKWDRDWTLKLRSQWGGSYDVALDDHPGKFWVTCPATTPGLPIDQGDFLAIVWPWLFMGWGYKFWLQAAEKFGNPMAWLEWPRTTTKETRRTMLDQLEQLQSTGAAGFDEGSKINVLDPKAQASSAVWKDLVAEFKHEIIFGLVGATDVLTPGSVGALAAVKERRGVMLESTATDSRTALNSFTRDVVEAGLYFNSYDGPVPQLSSQFPSSSDPIPDTAIRARVVKNDELRARLQLDPEGGTWGEELAQIFPDPPPPSPYGAPAGTPAPAPSADTTEPAAASGGAPAASPFPSSPSSAHGGMPTLSSTPPMSTPTSSRFRMSPLGRVLASRSGDRQS